MESEKIKIGLVGVDNHGRTILNAIKDAGSFELVSCFDTNKSASESVRKDFQKGAAHSYDELISDPAIEAVALVTPNHVHAEQMRKALEHKKHIFVEKPITNSVDDARDIIKRGENDNLVILVGHNARRKRTFREAKRLLNEGKLENIAFVEANLSRHAGLDYNLPDWKADPDKCPLLPMTQLGIHFIDVFHYLFSPIKSVYCTAENRGMGKSILDTAVAVLRSESGITMCLTSSYVTNEIYYFRIYGTNGILSCTSYSLKLETLSPPKIVEMNFSNEGAESYMLEMREFAKCIRSGTKPETDGVVGLRAVAVIEVMLKSVSTGMAEKIGDFQ
jgi:predicted dehydrogenase